MSDPVLDAMNAMAAERGESRADLEATGLVKVYGDRTVVNGMDVRCSCGQIVGILGPNGAGTRGAGSATSRRSRRSSASSRCGTT